MRILQFILLLAVAHLAGAAETNAPKTYRCTGTVVDTEGRPVAGAAVELYQYETRDSSGGVELALKQRVTADTNGAFELKLTPGTAFLMARKAGLAPAWKNWNPTGDSTERLMLKKPAALAGTVVDNAGKPVADAEVWVTLAWNEIKLDEGRTAHFYLSGKPARECFTTRTSADGRFRIEGLPSDSGVDLAVKKAGWALRESPREYVGPDTMRFRAGQEDAKLVLDAAGGIEGKVVTADTGKPLGTVRLVLMSERSGFFGGQEPIPVGADGTFRFADVAAGTYRIQAGFGTNETADWVADRVEVTVEAGQVTRDVQVKATRGGVLEVKVKEQGSAKPIAQANLNVNRSEYHVGTTTVSNGTAQMRLPPGEYGVNVYKEGWRMPEDDVIVEVVAGQTNRIEIEMRPPAKITGILRDPFGAPVAGLSLKVFPEYRANVGAIKTDTQGRFEIKWSRQYVGRSDETVCLLARDLKRKLAVAQDLDEDTTTLDLRLEPGLVVAGRVEDPNGKPLTNASASVYLWSGNSGSSIDQPVTTDAQGRFEVSALPPNRRYSASANAKGYGSASSRIQESEADTNRIELEPFVLRVADRSLAGQVVDENEKPVAGAYVNMYGNGQPNGHVRTDAQGRFSFEAVCEGQVQLSVSHQNSYGNTVAEGGDTNVVLALGSRSGSMPERRVRPSLTGKPLPDLAALDLSPAAVPAGKPVLLCLFDFEQRPSRRCLRLLAEQQTALNQKGVTVVAVQAAVVELEALKSWKDASPLPFALGRVPEKSDQYRWVSEVDSLPWLILSDAQGRVSAEGFALDELEAKLKALVK